MNNYYVYKHVNTNTGEVFYIGKGKGDRAYNKYNRNHIWNDYVKNNSLYHIEIISDNLTEDEAYDKEIFEINKIGLENLTNILPGGKSSFFSHNVDYMTIDELNSIIDDYINRNREVINNENINFRFNNYCKLNNITNQSSVNKFIKRLNKKV